MRRILQVLLIVCLLGREAYGQDPHYSQFHSSPVMINPALTGLFNGDLRIIGNYRDQWSFANAYKTVSLSADGAYAILRNGDFASAGVQLNGDKAGDLDFSTFQTSLSLSYSKALSGFGNQFLTAGFQFGYDRRSINYDNMVAFDPEPYETGAGNHFSYLDMASGLTWYFIPSPEIYIYLGGSVYHFNRPNQSFYNDGSDVLEPRYSVQGGFQFPLTEKLNIIPSAIFNTQDNYNEFVLGTYFKYKLNHITVMKETAAYAGVWYRNNDALIAGIRFDYNNYTIGITYDVNTSKLANASDGRGGIEINGVYILDKKFNASKRMRNRSVQCPKF